MISGYLLGEYTSEYPTDQRVGAAVGRGRCIILQGNGGVACVFVHDKGTLPLALLLP